MDFNLFDQKYILFVPLLLLVLVNSEDSREAFTLSSIRTACWTILEHKIHLGVADIHLVETWALLIEQSVDGEFGDDVLGLKECVNLYSRERVNCWIFILNKYILEDECCERLEMDFFECYLTLNPFGKVTDHLVYNCSLHLWELYRD